MSSAHHVRCHAAVAAFVARHEPAIDFLARFDALWGEARSQPADRVLASVRALCVAYSNALPSGAGCRVSEEQFRLEVQSLIRPSPAAAGAPSPVGRRP